MWFRLELAIKKRSKLQFVSVDQLKSMSKLFVEKIFNQRKEKTMNGAFQFNGSFDVFGVTNQVYLIIFISSLIILSAFVGNLN